jgi:hypothetical protein
MIPARSQYTLPATGHGSLFAQQWAPTKTKSSLALNLPQAFREAGYLNAS